MRKTRVIFKKYFLLNEDRSKVKELETVVNVNTLVKNMGSNVLDYSARYDELSLLLHPNPSAVTFYAQVVNKENDGGLKTHHPKIKFYFDETIAKTEEAKSFFNSYTSFFLISLEHFLSLYSNLLDHFFLNPEEQSHFDVFAKAQFVCAHQKEILRAANLASRNGQDVGEAVNRAVQDIFEELQKPK